MVLKVIRHKPRYPSLESFDSFQANKEEIWSFQARVLATQLALCVALANKMNQTADELPSRGEWKAGIEKILPQLVGAHNDSSSLCDTVGEIIDTSAGHQE